MSEENQTDSCDMKDDPKSCCSTDECKSTINIMSIITAVIITAILVGGGMYFWQNSKAPVKSPTPTTKTDVPKSTETTKTPEVDKADQTNVSEESGQTYKNNYFSFEYPKTWKTMGGENNVSLFTTERKKEYDSLIKSGKPFGGQLANIAIKYTVDHKSNSKKFEDILKEYIPSETAKLISSNKINGNNVTKYDFAGYGSEISYFAEVKNHLVEFHIAKGSDEKIMNGILKSLKVVNNTDSSGTTKTFTDYIKDVSEKMDTKFDPSGWQTIYIAKGVYNPCGTDPAGVCGDDVAILAKKDWDKARGKQAFYLKHYHKNPATITTVYRGPFTDDVARIVQDAKTFAEELKKTSK